MLVVKQVVASGERGLKQVDIVDTIYEAALIPEKWPDVLDRMAAMAGGVGTILSAQPARIRGGCRLRPRGR